MRRRDALVAMPSALAALGTGWSARSAAAGPDVSGAGSDPVRKVVGSQHVLALMADGAVVGWGRHRDGQLGEAGPLDARRRYAVAAPVRLALPGPAIDVAVGTSSSCVLLADGSVWTWGRGYDGELGLGPEAVAARLPDGSPGLSTPQRVAELSDIVQVTMADTVGHALRRDGAVLAWGPRDGGRIGDGLVPPRWGESVPKADRPVPVSLLNGTSIARLGVGAAGLAITADGRVVEWPPQRPPAQAGDVWQPLATVVSEMPLPGPAADVASTGGARLALLRDGTVWAWGWNQHGLFGNGKVADTNDPARFRATPQPVPGVRQAVALVAGTNGRHALVLLRDGTLRGWGNTDWGQLGAGVDGQFQPQAVTPKLAGVSRVWAGGGCSFACTRDRRFWAWGMAQGGSGPLAKQSNVPVEWPLSLLQPA